MAYNVAGLPESQRSFRGAAMVNANQSLGLWNSQQFRAYREFTATVTLRVVAAKNFILSFQNLYVDQGSARAVIVSGGTPSGTFTTVATQFCKNTTAGPVTGATVVSVGGSVSGGAEREVIRVATGGLLGSAGVGNTLQGARLLAAGTYYITITVTGTTSGIYSLEWEELD